MNGFSIFSVATMIRQINTSTNLSMQLMHTLHLLIKLSVAKNTSQNLNGVYFEDTNWKKKDLNTIRHQPCLVISRDGYSVNPRKPKLQTYDWLGSLTRIWESLQRFYICNCILFFLYKTLRIV